MKNLTINLSDLNEYQAGEYIVRIKTSDKCSAQASQSLVANVLDVLDSLVYHHDLSKSLCDALEKISCPYTLIITHKERSYKSYIITQDLPVLISRREGYTVSSSTSYGIDTSTDGVIALENGVLAEIYDEGTCLFKDKWGQRLNRKYLDAMGLPNDNIRAQLLSTPDYQWLLTKTSAYQNRTAV